jgi:hypothetical protein
MLDTASTTIGTNNDQEYITMDTVAMTSDYNNNNNVSNYHSYTDLI